MGEVDDTSETIIPDLHSAISHTFGKDGTLVNKWVLVVDILRPVGGRACAYIASEDLMTWEVVGMAESASEYARAQLSLEAIGYYEDEEDDEEEDEDR